MHVDTDDVAVTHECDRSAVDGLGCDVADAEPPRATAEPAVGDERAVGAAAGTFQGGRDRQHLTHPRSTLGALVADHEHRAGLDRTGHDGLHRTVLTVEHTSCAFELLLLLGESGDLHDRAAGSERAGEDDDASLLVQGLVERVHDHAVGGGRIELGQVLGHGLAGAGEDVAVQEAGIEEVLQHHRHPAHTIEITHVELAARLHVGDVGHLRRDAIEVLELEFDARLVRQRQQVEHGVGGSTEGRRDGNGVLEGLLGHDHAWGDTEAQHVHDGLAGAPGVVFASAVDGRR